MALVLKDRVKETTTTTGTGTYTLAGAVTGFEAFSSVGDGNTTYYACTDGTDFEVGIGTYTSSGTTLARTTILQSSNSDSAVSWSSGTRTIFCTQPAEKAVFLNADGDIEFDNTHRIKINSNTSDPVLAIAGGGPNFIRFHDAAGFNSTTNAVDIVYRTTPNDLLIERASGENIAEFGGDDGHAALYFNDSKKLETVSGGIDVTGEIAATSLDISGDVDVDGTLEADAMTLNGTAITTTATLSTGISNNNVPKFTSGVADNDFLRVDGTAIEGRSASEVLSDIAAMPLAGGTFSDDVTFTGASYNVVWDKSDNAFELADNAKLKFGAGDDMEIFSDGTYGRIDVNDLIIRGDDTDNRPQLYFQSYNTSNVVDYDTSTSFYFQGPNDAGEQVTYNIIHSITLDVSDGTEDGRLQFSQLEAGANATTFIFDPYYFLLMSEQQLAWYQYNGSYSTYLYPLTPTANRFIKLPDRDGLIRVVDQQAMTSDLAVGWHTIAVFQGRDDSGDANQRFHAKFSLIDITSSRHQAMTFYAQSMFGQDEGLQIIGNSTFGTDVVTAIRIKSSTDGNGLYAGAAIQVYVANATNNLVLYLDEANLDDGENGVSYGNVILKTGVADASDPGDVGYSSASYSTFAEDVRIETNSIEPGGIGVTGNLLTQSNIVLEGATADAHETIITATDPTADRTITLPDATGTVQLTDGSGASLTSLNASELGSGTVPNARLDAQLQDVAGLAVTNGNFIVGDGSNFVAESGATARTSLGLGTAAVLDTGISNTNVPKFTSGVADDDFLRVNGTDIEGRSASEVLSDIAAMPLAGGTFTGDVTLTDTDAGSAEGPVLTLNRDSSSPADADFLGTIKFNGDNDAGESIAYSQITTKIADNTDGTEDGNIIFKVYSAGTQNASLTMKGNATIFNNRDVRLDTGVNLLFEGATSNSNETTLTVTDPTADRTITLPDATGEVVLNSSGVTTLSSTADGGAILKLVSNDPSDATDWNVENEIQFFAENDASESVEYANIRLYTADVSDGTEDGWLYFGQMLDGTLANRFAMGPNSNFYLLSGGANDPAIEWNATKGTSYDVQLKTATPTADRTITLPDATGTVLTTGNSDTPTTTTSSSDADFVLVDDGGTMKKITPANLGITAGAASTDDATALAIALG